MVPHLRQNDYTAAAEAGVRRVIDIVDGECERTLTLRDKIKAFRDTDEGKALFGVGILFSLCLFIPLSFRLYKKARSVRRLYIAVRLKIAKDGGSVPNSLNIKYGIAYIFMFLYNNLTLGLWPMIYRSTIVDRYKGHKGGGRSSSYGGGGHGYSGGRSSGGSSGGGGSFGGGGAGSSW